LTDAPESAAKQPAELITAFHPRTNNRRIQDPQSSHAWDGGRTGGLASFGLPEMSSRLGDFCRNLNSGSAPLRIFRSLSVPGL